MAATDLDKMTNEELVDLVNRASAQGNPDLAARCYAVLDKRNLEGTCR